MKKKLIISLLILMVTASALWVVWWRLQLSDRLPIQAVQITGNLVHTDKNQLQQLTLPFVEQENFVTLNTQALSQRLETLPWVEQVTISRIWPDTLVVNVTEQVPVAIWQGKTLLNANADIFSPEADSLPQEMVRINGPTGQQKLILEQYQIMQKQLDPLRLTIRELNVSARQAWRLQLSTGMVILLGRREPLARLTRLTRVYNALVAPEQQRVDRIDMRYGEGMALHWRSR